jgi:hypothetical protein
MSRGHCKSSGSWWDELPKSLIDTVRTNVGPTVVSGKDNESRPWGSMSMWCWFEAAEEEEVASGKRRFFVWASSITESSGGFRGVERRELELRF